MSVGVSLLLLWSDVDFLKEFGSVDLYTRVELTVTELVVESAVRRSVEIVVIPPNSDRRDTPSRSFLHTTKVWFITEHFSYTFSKFVEHSIVNLDSLWFC